MYSNWRPPSVSVSGQSARPAGIAHSVPGGTAYTSPAISIVTGLAPTGLWKMRIGSAVREADRLARGCVREVREVLLEVRDKGAQALLAAYWQIGLGVRFTEGPKEGSS